MTSLPERKVIIGLIQEATNSGARLAKACALAGISLRTYRRWFKAGHILADGRPEARRPAPINRLTNEEKKAILDTCNAPTFASLPPSQIVPKLLDQGIYIASESSYYRVLKAHNQVHQRGRAQVRNTPSKPDTFIASEPNEVYCWDITYIPSVLRGQYFYLYLIEDVYSRKIVGAEVYEEENGGHAKALLQRTLIAEQCHGKPLVLHSDNGAPMKSQTLRAKLEELGIVASFSRPRVSNDNPYVESLFRTLKYCPQWPSGGFKSLDAARAWVQKFIRWYNCEHLHSKLNFITPEQRHKGLDQVILAERKVVLEQAKLRTPERWCGRDTRNCEVVGSVALNPESDTGKNRFFVA